tara:strand:+ start:22367 stop:23065 length:699 start_codon:yes stop_codon:yes gene_type:complete
MKKNLILLISISLINFNFLFSQSLAVSGDSIVYGIPSNFQVESHLYVKNLTSSPVLVFCEKNIISQIPDGTNTFCWAGTCYSETTYISTKADTLEAGEESNGFSGYYHPWGISSQAEIEYCFFLSTDTINKFCKTVFYDAIGFSNVNNFDKIEKISDFFPNPIQEYTKFRYNIDKKSFLQITDVIGNVVKTIEIQGVGEQSMYLGNLNKGVYFGNLIQDGEIIKIKKLIINK